uniref:ABC transporter ATP-binding protein n=1 Tax=Blastomonas sp. TaxID=1909299 RepID=UPI003593C6AA
GAGFALQTGRISCLLGPSGCGKSTILRLIAGLEPVDEGAILIRGESVSAPGHTLAPEQRGVGLVFQDNALFPHLNVGDNVGFGVRHLKPAARQELVHSLLARLQVDHLVKAWPHTLSGGEQQRVAIARALAREPVLLLLDEPFSGLDGHLRSQIRRSLIEDLRDVGATVLVVTHDPEEAMMIADDLILMANGQILQTGTPEECHNNPVSPVAAHLLGEAILLPVGVSNGIAETPFGRVQAPGLPDAAATMMVRPSDLRVADEGAPASVISSRRFGSETVATVAFDATEFTIRTHSAGVSKGRNIRLTVNLAAVRILAIDTG